MAGFPKHKPMTGSEVQSCTEESNMAGVNRSSIAIFTVFLPIMLTGVQPREPIA